MSENFAAWAALVCAAVSVFCFWLVHVRQGATIAYLDARLRLVKDRAEVEFRAGAPATMVAFYVAIEVEHALARHDGDAMVCNPCHGLPARLS